MVVAAIKVQSQTIDHSEIHINQNIDLTPVFVPQKDIPLQTDTTYLKRDTTSHNRDAVSLSRDLACLQKDAISLQKSTSPPNDEHLPCRDHHVAMESFQGYRKEVSI